MTNNQSAARLATNENGDALRIPTLSELATLAYHLGEYVYWRQVVNLGLALYGPAAKMFELDGYEELDHQGNLVVAPVRLMAYDKDGKRIRHFDFTTTWWNSPIIHQAITVMGPEEKKVLTDMQRDKEDMDDDDGPLTPLQFINGVLYQRKDARGGIVPSYMLRGIEQQRVAHTWLDRDNFYCSLLDVRGHRGVFRVDGPPSTIDTPPTIYIPADYVL